MSDDLLEIDERIKFCASEIDVYTREAKSFLDNAFTVKKRMLPITGAFNIYATLTKPVPVALRARAGVITHELRSCLDSLACQLAKRNDHTKVSDVYFPVSRSEEIFLDDGLKKIRKLSDSDKQTILDLRPYLGGHPFLFALHEADRTRKHQRLAACTINNAQMMVGPGISVRGNSELTFQNIDVGGVFLRNFTLGANNVEIKNVGQEVKVLSEVPAGLNLHIFFGLSYLEPRELAGFDVYQSLLKFKETVQSVVNLFK
jgi:hypothetical protein